MKIFGTKRNADHIAKKGGKAKKVIITLLVLALLLGGGAYAFMTLFVRPPEPQDLVPPRETPSINQTQADPVPPDDFATESEQPDILTLLIAGQDDVGEYGLSDTVMLVALDVTNGRVNVINIPRDLKVDGPAPKINAVYAMTGGSMDRLMEAAEAITGFMPQNYVMLDMQAFADLVDVIDGVYFDVPRRMLYDDPYQDLHINLEAGWQHLNGDQALQFVRWRQNNDGTGLIDGDLGRIGHQQDFMRALAGELLQIGNVARIGDIARIFTEYVETDLYLGNIVWFAQQLMSMDSENITFLTIPNYEAVINGGYYQVIQLEEWLEMLNAYLNPSAYEIREENLRVFAWTNGSVQLVGEGLAFVTR